MSQPISSDASKYSLPIDSPYVPEELPRSLEFGLPIPNDRVAEEAPVAEEIDGGKEAWLCVGSSFLVLYAVHGFVNNFGQLQTYYLAHQLANRSKSDVAWLGVIQAGLTFLGQIVFGIVFDRRGPRLLVWAGVVLSLGAIAAMAFCHVYYQFLLAHTAFGIAASMLYTPCTAVVGHWFTTRKSTVAGIILCGSGIAGIGQPIMMQRLFAQTGFRNTMLIFVGVNAVLLTPACLFIKSPYPPSGEFRINNVWLAWKDTRYIMLMLGIFFIMLNYFSPYFNAIIFATSHSHNIIVQQYALVFIQCGAFIGRMGSGFLADGVGVWSTFVGTTIASVISLFGFWTPRYTSDAVSLIALITYGISSGATVTLIAAVILATSPRAEIGARLGTAWLLTGLSFQAGPTVCGVLIALENGGFMYTGLYCALTTLIGCMMAAAPDAIRYLHGLKANPQKV